MQTLFNCHDLILCFFLTLEARDLYISHYSSRVAEMTEKCVICLIYLQIKRKVQRLLDNIMNDLMGKVILMDLKET